MLLPSYTIDEQAESLGRRVTETLGQKLPSFMVPTHVVVLDTFPKTPSGKIDRRQLRSTKICTGESKISPLEQAEPEDEFEQTSKLRKAWAEVLNIPEREISRDSSWIELGGDSLSAISASHKAKEQGLVVGVADLLQHTTIEELAQRSRLPVSQPDESDGYNFQEPFESRSHRVTSFQRYTMAVSSSPLRALVYHYIMKVRGTVDVNELERAARKVFRRCDSLRMVFENGSADSAGFTRIALDPENEELSQRVRVVHCSDADSSMQSLYTQSQSSDSGDSALPALWIMLVSPGKIRMLARFHHAVIDGTSISLIFEDFQRAINPSTALQSRMQFLPYLNKRLLLRETLSLDYWRTLLRGSRPTMLRRSLAELAPNDSDVSAWSKRRIVVPYPTSRGLATMSTLVKAAWAIVLSATTVSDDVVFYHLLNGRDEEIVGSLEIVGCCVTEVPMRVKLPPSLTGKDLLEHVQDQVITSTPHAQLGADTIAAHCTEWAEKINYRHSRFVHHTNVKEVWHLQLGDGAYADVETRYNSDAVQDFSITSSPIGGGGLEIEIEAPKALYSQEEVDIVADGIMGVVRMLADEQDCTVESIKKRLAVIKI